MCYQKAIKRAAKPLSWFWDSNTRLHSDMYPYVPLSQPWLWHYVEFVGIYMFLCKIHTHTDNTFIYIHIRTQYMHIHTYTCTYMLIVASYIHIHACANHGREGSLGGCGRRSMSQGATQLPQSVGMRLGIWSTSVDLAWDPIQPRGGGRFRDLRQWRRGGVREIGLLEGTGME